MKKIERALKFSALEDDMKLFPDGLDQETGENGDALSGGQRTRLAIAQALYQEPDIFLFDDILSALDTKVGSFIMSETILNELKGKTIIMSTHAVQYISKGDRIYLIDAGKISKVGTFEEISQCDIYQAFLEMNKDFENKNKENIGEDKAAEDRLKIENEIKKSVKESLKASLRAFSERKSLKKDDGPAPVVIDDEAVLKLMIPEDREKGGISIATFKTFVSLYGGIFGFGIVFIVGTFCDLIDFAIFYLLTYWSANFATLDSQEYLRYYVYFCIFNAVFSAGFVQFEGIFRRE